MTSLRGAYPFLASSVHSLLFSLMIIHATTLPALQVTSYNNLTSRLTTVESVTPLQSYSHPPLPRSWEKNVTLLLEKEDAMVATLPRRSAGAKVMDLTSDTSARSPLTSNDDDSSPALPLMTYGSFGHRNLEYPYHERGTEENIPECRYNLTAKNISSSHPSEKIDQTFLNMTNDTGHIFPEIVKRSLEEERQNEIPSELRVQRHAITQGPLWTAKGTLFVELVVIGDYSFCQHHGENALNRINQIVGVANMLYKPLGVVVVLADVHLWRSGNRANVYPIKEKTLNSMTKYREQMISETPEKAYDNLMLITRELEYGAGGVASTGAMCYGDKSVNIVQDVKEHPGIVGSILAHEMGHNFGMKHDGEGDYFPRIGNCRNAHSIMEASLNVQEFDTNLFWSDCSREYISKNLRTTDFDCLKNIPTRTYSTSCGNGIVEYGEECDCGIPELCQNKCCNPKTCRLAQQASCASGACCNTETCKPHSVGTVCREAHSDCDLPEYCSGENESCPSDVQKGDGSYCSYGQGHCYKGVCGSHVNRCRQLWGNQAYVSSQQCYQNLTHRGDRAGNCGFDLSRDQYRYCEKDASRCGTLYCDARGIDKVELSGRTNHHTGNKWVGSSLCQYVEGYLSHYPAEDWLTPNGASCGDRKMCLNQKCVQVPGTDDGLNCPRKCSGRGICNSQGNCHCNPGYAPPDCANPGHGGSYNSGQAPSRRGGVLALWIILILIIVLVIICVLLGCFWSKIRLWWEMTGRGWISSIAPPCALCIDDCFCSAISKAVHYLVASGPLGKVRAPFQKKDPDIEKPRKISKGYRVDVEVKRLSHPDYFDHVEQNEGTLKGSHLQSSRPTVNNKLPEPVSRPKYHQSISVDSGCVVEDADELQESPSADISLSSLVNVFRSYTSRTQTEVNKKDIRKSTLQDHHKEISLRRLVTDPRAGSHGGKKSLPQPYQNPPHLRHSISVDISVEDKGKGTINDSEVQIAGNLCKSHDEISTVPKLADNPFMLSNSKNTISNNHTYSQKGKQLPNVHASKSKHNATKSNSNMPVMTLSKSRTPPRTVLPCGPTMLSPVKEITQEPEVKVLGGTSNNSLTSTGLRSSSASVNTTTRELSLKNGNYNEKNSSVCITKCDKGSAVFKKTVNKSTPGNYIGLLKTKACVEKKNQVPTKKVKSNVNVPRVNETKNVKSIAQKFENL
ncbi:hypothetical protein SK128_011450 [Halocaridina rubra]|uniref:Uncharacterized protein n=1 Tax=Halocaridina rubra TaxID=373956 RepID=A0AAN8X3Z5_HALRR